MRPTLERHLRGRAPLALFSALAAVLLWQVAARAALTGVTLSPGFASTSGGTVIGVSIAGTYASVTATLDGAPIPILTSPSGSRAIVAPPHAAGSAAVVVTANDNSSASTTLTYIDLPAIGLAGAVTRVSLGAAEQQGTIRSGDGGGSGSPAASASGDVVAFSSDTDLGFGAPGTGTSLYVKDRTTGALSLVAQCDCPFSPSLSLDGTRIVYRAVSGGSSVALYKDAPFTGPAVPVDVNDAGSAVAPGELSSDPIVSGNGRFVVFTSTANLDANSGDPAGSTDLFVRDLLMGLTERWTLDATISGSPSISADGRYVAVAPDNGLVATDTNSQPDVYLIDRSAPGAGPRLLTNPALNVGATHVAMSSGGSVIAFNSAAANLVSGDTNGVADVFVMDLRTGLTTLVSRASDSALADGGSTLVSVSGNGRRVAFTSAATNLTSPAPPAGTTNLYVHDRTTGATMLVAAAGDGTFGDALTSAGVLAPDGRSVLLSSVASNLVLGDTNAMGDVFAKALPPDVPAGTMVQGDPFDPVVGKNPVTLVFDQLTTAGNVAISIAGVGPGLDPGFTLVMDYFDLSTTAAATGSTQVCVSYAGETVADEATLRLLRHNGIAWSDVTTLTDTTGKKVCGLASTLGVFAMALPPPGYTPAALSLAPQTAALAVGTTKTFTVSISLARADDLPVLLVSSAPGVASAPSQVTITGGQTSTSFTVTAGATNGHAVLTASAPGVTSAIATLNVGTHLVEWVTDADGFWDEAANWSGGVTPSSGDAVVIDRPAANVVVTIRTPTAAIQSLSATELIDVTSGTLNVSGEAVVGGGLRLRQNGAALAGSGKVRLDGPMDWQAGGVMLGGGLEVAPGQTVTLSAIGGYHLLNNSTLTNHGTVTWLGDPFYFNGTATVTNELDGVWNAQGDLAFAFLGNQSGTESFINLGLLRKTAGAGALIFGSPITVTNAGTFEVQTGNVSVATMTNSGLLQLAAGATFDLSNVTLLGSSTFAGAGTLLLTGAGSAMTTIPTGATVAVTLPMRMSANHATFLGGGKLVVAAPLDWRAGTVSLGAGLEVAAGHTVTLSAIGGYHLLTNSTLINHGTVTWLGDPFYLNGTAAVTNASDGVWDVQGDLAMTFLGNQSGAESFTNLGLLRKTAGAGALIFGSPITVTNTGTFEVQTGTVSVATMTNSGLLQLAAGATFDLSDVTLLGSSTFAGAGTLLLTGAGSGMTTIPLNETVTITIPTRLSANQASFVGGGKVIVAGPMDWRAGTIRLGAGLDIAAGQAVTLGAIGGYHLLNNSTLVNHGTVTWLGDPVYLNGTAAITNASDGQWIVQGDLVMTFLGSQSGAESFTNQGVLRKTAGSGALIVGSPITVTNTGTFEVQTGTVSVATMTNSGLLQLAAGATFDLSDVTLLGSSTFAGAGTLLLTGAGSGMTTIPLNETVTITIPTRLSANQASFVGGGKVIVAGPMDWRAGTIRLGAGLDIAAGQAVTLGAIGGYHLLNNSTLTNHGTVTWLGDPVYLNGTAAITNASDGQWIVQGDLVMTFLGSQSGAESFTNQGMLRKTAGAGTLIVGSPIAVTNTGTFEVQTGNVSVATMTNSGLLQLAAGATFDLSDVTLLGSSTFAGAGTLLLTGAGSGMTTIPLNETVTITIPTRLSANQASFVGGGKVIVAGPMDWRAGTIALGAGLEVAAGQTATLGAIGGYHLLNNSTLTNHGTVTWLGDPFYLNGTAAVTNGADGVWDVQVASAVFAFLGSQGGSESFTNLGVLKKTAGIGPLIFGSPIALNNAGTIQLRLGGAGGGQFDTIAANQVSLAGTLDIRLGNGFTPAAGNEFAVMTYSTRSGAFGTLTGDGFTYDACYQPTTLTLCNVSGPAKVTPVITWPTPAGITFGTLLSPTQLTASANVAGTFVYQPAAGTRLDAGSAQPLSVSFTPTDTVHYNEATATAFIDVYRALLTVTAEDATKVDGAPNPAFTYSISGLIPPDTSLIVGGLPSMSTPATDNSPAGTYPLTIAQGSMNPANYTFAFVNATFTITPAAVSLCTGYAPLPGRINTLAGSGTEGFSGDGAAANLAALSLPFGAAFDNGALYLADTNNHRIRRVDLTTCVITTVAGTGIAGFSGDGNQAISARFNAPRGVAAANGKLYIADTGNHHIRQIDLTTGVITTLAGGTAFGSFGGDGGPATAAGLNTPFKVSVADGSLFIADRGNQRVRRVSLTTGIIDTVAGTGSAGYSGDGGTATSAGLSFPSDMSAANGALYIADFGNHRVRRVDLATGIITTAAGNGGTGLGSDNVPASSATVWGPSGIAIAGASVLVAEESGRRVRQLDLTTNTVTTLAGTGSGGFSGDGGPATSATLQNPEGIAIGPSAAYVADTFNHRIRRVDIVLTQAALFVTGAPANAESGSSFTVATSGGSGHGAVTFSASGACSNTGGGAVITMTAPAGTCSITATKASDGIYPETTSAAVSVNATPEVILCSGYLPVSGVINTFAGTGASAFSGDGGRGHLAALALPFGAAVANGALFIADANNHRVRRVDLATCVITTVAGTGVAGFSGDGNQAINARLNAPHGVAAADGQLYIADTNNNHIRQVDLTSGVITTVAGGTLFGSFSGDGGPAANAGLSTPFKVSVADGSLFIADRGNQRVRRVDLTTGIIETIAGTGTAGYSGDGGAATSADLSFPSDMSAANGALFIADFGNNRVRSVDLATGIIATAAGTGSGGLTGDDGPATAADVWGPSGIVAVNGTVFVAEESGRRVRHLDLASGAIRTIAGTGAGGFSGDGGPASAATLRNPEGLAVGSGALFIADTFNHRVRRVDLLLAQAALTVTGAPASADHGSSFTVGYAGGSGAGAVTFSALGACSTAGGALVTMTSATGTCTVTADKAGDAVYGAATTATVAVTATEPLAVVVIAPNGGETAVIGTSITIRWSASGAPSSFDVDLSRDGGATFETVGGCTALPGTATTCDWTPTAPATITAIIRVTARRNGGAAVDASDAVWTIANPASTVVARNGVVTTSEGASVTGVLQATVSGGGAPTFAVTVAPVRGQVTVDPATGAFTYTPNTGATGYDPFTFTATSGASSSQATEMVFVVANSPRWPGQTIRASVSGSAAEANGVSGEPSFSADGRFVAFTSFGSSLVPGDTNGAPDAFVLDRQTGGVTRISVASDGAQANSGNSDPKLSADGRFVAFRSNASNLVPGDSNGLVDVFVHDRLTHETSRVSVSSSGVQGTTHIFTAPALSADGRFVAFVSPASNLVDGDTNGMDDVFVHDRQTGQTTRVSVASDGSQANFSSVDPKLSADGRFVAFQSGASNLVAGDTNGNGDIFVHDRQTGQTTRVSLTNSGTEDPGNSIGPAISADGRFVAFHSGGGLVAGDLNSHYDIFVRDRQTAQTTLVSRATTGAQGNFDSAFASISADGRFVAFLSPSSTLAAGDTNGFADVFVHDRQTGETVRVGVAGDGTQTNGETDAPALSADGRFVGISSVASNLVPGDTNGSKDVFVIGGVSVSPRNASFAGAGGTGAADVTFVYPGTPWTATAIDSWITVTNQSSPSGSGTVTYTIAPNNSSTARTGTVTVAAQSVAIAQSGAPLAVAVVSPNGGDKAFVGVPITIRWTTTGAATSVDVELSRNGGTTFAAVAGCTGLPGTATSCDWTPTTPATTTATLRVTARRTSETASDVSDAVWTIANATPFITVTSPNTALAWATGSRRDITWNHNLAASSLVRIELSRNGGTSWELLASSVQNSTASSGTFPWIVTGPSTATALVRVTWTDGPASDVSNAAFAIVAPAITVTAPNTNVSWDIGSSHNLAWTHNLGAAASVRIEASSDGGATWRLVMADVANSAVTTGSFDWIVSGPVTNRARIRVIWTADNAVLDVSDVDFRVASRITVTSPNTSLTWGAGSTRTITWSHNYGAAQTFDVAFSPDNGTTWVPLASSIAAVTATAGAFTGPMPTTVTAQALIRVSPAANAGDGDVSNVTFTLAAPSIAVTAPNTNVNWDIGSSRSIVWTHNLGAAESVRVEVSRDGGATWTAIPASVLYSNTSGSFDWTVTGPVTTRARFRVMWLANNGVQDISDVDFRVGSAITVTSPNTAVTWTAGTTRTLTWNHSLGIAATFDVEFSGDAGATWTPLASGVGAATATTGTAAVQLPAVATTQALVRVSPAGNPANGDTSDVLFALVAPSITVTAPNTNVSWVIGSSHNITWSQNLGTTETVRIDASYNGGASWTTVASNVANGAATGSFSWIVSGPVTMTARVRVVWTRNGAVQDASDVNFRVASPITVTSPNTTVTWALFSLRTISWTHSLGAGAAFDLAMSTDGGVTWVTRVINVPAATATTGTVDIQMLGGLTSQALIQVSPAGRPQDGDINDVPFSLVSPAITVTAPNTNVSWTIGSARTINWSHNLGSLQPVQIHVSRDGGATWQAISLNAPNGTTTGSLSWTVTGPATTSARIRVSWSGTPTVNDVSDVNFRIQ